MTVESDDFLYNKQPVVGHLVDLVLQEVTTDLSSTAFIGMAHLLDTFLSVPLALIRLGAKPENMIFTGKYYSDSAQAIAALRELGVTVFAGELPKAPGYCEQALKASCENVWDAYYRRLHDSCDKLIMLDEDMTMGRTLSSFTLAFERKIAAVIQTRRGMYSPLSYSSLYPIINVAECAAKKLIESKFIAEEVAGYFSERISSQQVFGIVGFGSIVKAVAAMVKARGCSNILIYDKAKVESKEYIVAPNLEGIFANCSDIVFCTGQLNVLDFDPFDVIRYNRDVRLYNAASSDLEMQHFLQTYFSEADGPLDDLVAFNREKNIRVIVMRGGTPVNFSNNTMSVPHSKIQITRSLIVAASLQLCSELDNVRRFSVEELNHETQSAIVACFSKHVPAEDISESVVAFEQFLGKALSLKAIKPSYHNQVA